MARFAFGVILKAPREGYVKTRLLPTVSPLDAALLHTAFVGDTCASIAAIQTPHEVDGFAVYTPAGSEAAIRGIVPPTFRLLLQRGEQFGDRLVHAARDLLAQGYDGIFLVDSDSPTVPTAYFARAIELLAVKEDCAVLGPCEDGGYYLLGLKRAHPALFERIEWSTGIVAFQTRERAREIALPVSLLPSWYDVDDAASLRALVREISSPQARGGIGYSAVHSRACVHALLRKGLFADALV